MGNGIRTGHIIDYLVSDKNDPMYNQYKRVLVAGVNIDTLKLSDGNEIASDDIDDVFLNDDLLRKMGFCVVNKGELFMSGNVMLKKAKSFYSVVGYDNVIIKFLRTLQDLYLLFNGKELDVKL